MNKLLNRNVVLRAGLILILLVVLQGCKENQPIESWDSPRMLVIEKDQVALKHSNFQSNGDYTKYLKKLNELFDEVLSNRDVCYLVSTASSLPSRAKDRSDFTNTVLKYLAEKFLLTGDRNNLVTLLSLRFYDRLFLDEPIEYAMAHRMKDSILLVGEAYAKSQNEESRHHLAMVLRRAFLGSGISGKDDTEFVKNAMEWYKKEKGHLVVTRDFQYFAEPTYDDYPGLYNEDHTSKDWQIFGQSIWPAIEKLPLFVDKSSEPER